MLEEGLSGSLSSFSGSPRIFKQSMPGQQALQSVIVAKILLQLRKRRVFHSPLSPGAEVGHRTTSILGLLSPSKIIHWQGTTILEGCAGEEMLCGQSAEGRGEQRVVVVP